MNPVRLRVALVIAHAAAAQTGGTYELTRNPIDAYRVTAAIRHAYTDRDRHTLADACCVRR
ncbi:MAG TPA: hypothetical protein VMW56_00815 [Candidatus Margulisiibacteriota bacterium]|nr:hypothetical protein [Candidatus Margulisiibacteriota bacterium]